MEKAAEAFGNILRPSLTGETYLAIDTIERQMLDVSIDCIKVISPDGILLHMNRAGCLALGVPLDGPFGMPWVPLLPPGVHDAGYRAIAEAAMGHSARFPGRSENGGNVLHWDNLLTPIFSDTGSVKAVLCVSRDVTEQTNLKNELAASIERERLLTQEMRHRIKNLFSVVSGLISLTERQASNRGESTSVTDLLRDKLWALSRASDATFTANLSSEGQDTASELGQIVRSVLAPYAEHIDTHGTTVLLYSKNMTTVALVLHELATNAVKYGALSTLEGHITVRWRKSADQIIIEWSENGGPEITQPPKKYGFGSRAVERFIRSLGGDIEMIWNRSGLLAKISLPDFR